MRQNRRITPEGTRDLLFEESLARREAEGMLSDLFVGRGFSEVMTPGMEFYDVFHADTMAIPAESMYKFADAKGRLLVMRPDSTMPIARLVATRMQNARLPLRLYYAQDVYRFHHGLSGHYDQMFQAGVELIGAAGERADLEVLSLAAEALRQSVGEGFRLEIGHVGFFQSLMRQLPADGETKDAIRTLIENKNYAGLSDELDALPPSQTVDVLRRLPRLFGGEEVLRAAASLCHDEDTKEALACLARRRSQARLRREGTAVSGTVRSVRHHIFVTWNTQSFVNVPGRNSPWSAVCGYTWGGRDYTVSTGLLWGEPQEGSEVLVWLDPDRPGRAFVDPDSVRLDLMG